MKKENILELKKSYTSPKMDMVELKHETNLLQCSDGSGLECPEGAEGG